MSILKKIFNFYYDGFRNMPKWGRIAWTIIILKGVIIFILVKFIFFPNFLKKNFNTDEERANYVFEQLTDINNEHDATEH